MMKKSLALFVLLIVVLASQGIKEAEARVCESQSHHFKGLCMRNHNCAMVCRTEGGFSGGLCRGFRRRCFCTRRC